jgi:hypothetical protein
MAIYDDGIGDIPPKNWVNSGVSISKFPLWFDEIRTTISQGKA